MDANLHTLAANDSINADSIVVPPGDGDIFMRGLADRRGPLRIPLMSRLPVPAFCCDLSGAVVSHNDAAAELWGRHPDPTKAGQWSGALSIHALDGAPLPRTSFPVARAIALGSDLDGIELLIERPDGTRRRVAAHPKLARGPDGAVAGAFCVLVDNTEREQLAEELKRVDDDRSAFLSLLAHELRNPLSPILSAACLMKKVSTDARICTMADVVERQVKLLSRFVADLLDASNLAENGILLRRADSTLGTVVDCALEEVAPEAARRGQSVSVDFEGRDESVFCDPERVSQALANVLINASEFTGDGGRIGVRIRVDGTLMEAEVKDDGIGIPAAHIDKIFKPYSQFESHRARMRSGVGLGLALAKDICEQHGGLITATSDGPGQGSRFRLILPIVQPKGVAGGQDHSTLSDDAPAAAGRGFPA